ncbi:MULTISPECIES: PDDEXK nuclease domain-containing protein [unclassified Fibrobacter]|uniref:PDDEXK nuclease domain-containing protein n=1 Tax=unclassified Fibrobacter TaxID=2634177 RepID=UPI0009200C1F|nr:MULTISPECIES: PDDEXK nuclease domain-containing protein [unclassified Fibrobacter]OWV02661.1 hypothetical protein B7993_14875 [Fibrobacter sp. UWH3]SHL33207.1 Predicted nuclease of restriction endonuclease-like (RecB) superfamily, DUF1016 family [Fibrobacter sp. UWH6]
MTKKIVLQVESEYGEILQQAVAVIKQARVNVARQLNVGENAAYWEIGKMLHERKLDSKHGNSVVRRLSVDLKEHFPDMGVAPRNLWNMKKFYERFSKSNSKVQQAVALLPWGHILQLMRTTDDDNQILFYASECVAKGWTRDLLINAVKMQMYERAALNRPQNNFKDTLPEGQAEFANEAFRSTYNLGFLGITEPVMELELERKLVEKVRQFLLELGKGFAFIGNQHELEFNGKASRVDMLFFHRQLKCLVAIDLKVGEFKPEYVGKRNPEFYLQMHNPSGI